MNVNNPGEAPTKELFVPATVASGAGTMGLLGQVPVGVLGGLNDTAHMAFHCPHDFNVIIDAVIICIPITTQAAEDWGYQVTFAGDGEAYNVHNAGDSVTTYNGTANQYIEVDVAPNLGAMVAGDRGGIALILEDALHDVRVLGFRLRYT